MYISFDISFQFSTATFKNLRQQLYVVIASHLYVSHASKINQIYDE